MRGAPRWRTSSEGARNSSLPFHVRARLHGGLSVLRTRERLHPRIVIIAPFMPHSLRLGRSLECYGERNARPPSVISIMHEESFGCRSAADTAAPTFETIIDCGEREPLWARPRHPGTIKSE